VSLLRRSATGEKKAMSESNDNNRPSQPLDAVRMLADEFEFVHDRQLPEGFAEKDPDERMRALRRKIHSLPTPRSALCLSGGGIRSATFSLGVLQALAANGLLKKFNYLSTVSGGGYIGSWLSSWIAREQSSPYGGIGKVVHELGNSRALGTSDSDPVRRLRAYSNYLSPVWGLSLDFITLITTFARNLFLNWLVLIPALLAILLVPRINVSLHSQVQLTGLWAGWIALLLLLPCALAILAIAYIGSDMPGNEERKPLRSHFITLCLAPMTLACVLLGWVWAWMPSDISPETSVVDLPQWVPFAQSLCEPTGCSVGVSWGLGAAVGALIHLAGYGIGHWWRRRRQASPAANPQAGTPSTWKTRVRTILFVLGTGALAAWLLLLAASWLFPRGPRMNHAALATFGMPMLLVCVWLGCNMYAALTRLFSSESDREWWSRASAWFLYIAGAWIIAHVLAVYVPSLILQLYDAKPELTVGSGGLLGIVAGIVGFWNKNGLGRLAEQAKGIGAKLGDKLVEALSLLFIVSLLSGLALVTSAALDRYVPQTKTLRPVQTEEILASPARTQEAATEGRSTQKVAATEQQHRESLAAHYMSVFPSVPWWISGIVFLALLAVVRAASRVVGANTFSMQAMYGNRLVRAYLGATRQNRDPHLFTGFDHKDNIDMSRLQQRGGLFHVVNVALNMVAPSGDRLEWQQRKAAPFTISPLHSGSCHLGYQPSDTYANGISLGRAMTLSGAAASPNMGYHTSSLVTVVLAFFNVRLGGWLPNPGKAGEGHWEKADPNESGPGVINEALGRTTDRQPYVYLSDGGHFENLGLYEMVYRRCSDIVVVDAGCDPNYEYEDLENAIRKVRTDLGIAIEFVHPLPTPQTAKDTGRHFSVGVVRYKQVDGPKARDGRIIYIKPVLSGDEPVDVARYASLHTKERDKFPQQSTADQFFDEAQFESYRELGRHSASSLPTLLPVSLTMPIVPPPVPAAATAAASATPAKADDGSGAGAATGSASPTTAKVADAVTGSMGVVESAARSVGSLNTLSTISAVLVTSFVLHTSLVEKSPASDSPGSDERQVLVDPLPDGTPDDDGPRGGPGAPDRPPPTDVADDTPAPPVDGDPIPTDPTPTPVVDPIPVAAGPERLALPLFVEARECKSLECRIGASPESYSHRYLKNLADALLACAVADDPVSVSVQGFASSSGFKGKDDEESDAANLELANTRARVVGKMLAEQVSRLARDARPPSDAMRVSVKVKPWTSLAEMRASIRYVDNQGAYHTSRGRLNRRVDLVFDSLGTCSLPTATPLAPVRTAATASPTPGP
jgi:hypothetical protein